MFITKKHLPRRTLLKGVGASLTLPLLDAMIPATTALRTPPPVRRGFADLVSSTCRWAVTSRVGHLRRRRS